MPNEGVIYNGNVVGTSSEILELKADNQNGLGTGMNIIQDLDELTINATGDSVKDITGYGQTTISNVKQITVTSSDDAVHVMGDVNDGKLSITGFESLTLQGGAGYGLQSAASDNTHQIEIEGAEGSTVVIKTTGTEKNALKSQGAKADISIKAETVEIQAPGQSALCVENGKVAITAAGKLTIQTEGTSATGVEFSGGELNLSGSDVSILGSTGIKLASSSWMSITADNLTVAGNITASKEEQIASSGNLSLTSVHEDKVMNASFLGSVEVGTLMLNNVSARLGAGKTFTASTLTGSGSTLFLNGFAEGDTPTVSITSLSASDFSVIASGTLNDQYANPQDLAQALQKAVSAPTEGKNAISFGAEAGSTSDGFTVNADGTLNISANASLAAVGSFSTMTLSQWRSEINHLSERLGDVRADSHAVGAWARVYGYESTATDAVKVKMKASSIQAGADVRLSPNWLVGAAFSYTDLDADFSNGDGSSDGYSLAAYASGFFDCGGYLDVISRIGRLSSSVTAATGTAAGGVLRGDYDNTALSLSAEAGYHWKLTDVFYLEPQAELSYGIVLGDDFTSKSNGVKISQDDFETLVGRLGIRAGSVFADGRGQVYAHASVHHDFLGNADSSAAPSVGAQFVLENSMTFYGMIERANSSEYDEDYRYSVGMRYAF